VNQIRLRGESPEIISDVVNEKLQFSIVSEVLAPIKSSSDRDALYLEIIKPFAPTRPQLNTIIALLHDISPNLHEAIFSKKVQQALLKCKENQHPLMSFLKLLAGKSQPIKHPGTPGLEEKVSALRKTYFGEKAGKRDFNVTPASTADHDELIIQFRLKKGQTQDILGRLQQLLQHDELFGPTEGNKNSL
jgi:ParB family chromosome partitioning protein